MEKVKMVRVREVYVKGGVVLPVRFVKFTPPKGGK